MNERPRDWDKELADIDKVIARAGSAPAPAPGPGGAPVSPPTRPVPRGPGTTRGHIVLTWFWVFLAVALSASLLLWPYDKTCGLQLTFFLGASATTAIFALLGAFSSWLHRRALAHVLSLLVLLSAAVAAGGEVLPRIGYAKETRTWLCASPPVTPASVAPAATAPAPGATTPTSTTPGSTTPAPTPGAPAAPAPTAPAGTPPPPAQ